MFPLPPDPYIKARLRALDLLIHREILRLRTRYRLSQDEFRGLYVSDGQVDGMIGPTSPMNGSPDIDALTRDADLIRKQSARHETPLWSGVKSGST